MANTVQLFIIVALTTTINALCPQQLDLLPCECYMDDVTCAGHEFYSLKDLFKSVSSKAKSTAERHLTTFTLHNTAITEFDDNVFGDIMFYELVFNGAESFRHIRANSLSNMVDSLESVLVVGETQIGGESEADLFHSLSSLNRLRAVQFERHRIHTIPENAFANSKQTQLESIDLNYSDAQHRKALRQITSIGNRAFYSLRGLITINLYGHSIANIAAQAFDFETASNDTLYIHLSDNPLNGTIEKGAFAGARRPVRLDLFDAGFEFVDETIFATFLKADKRNHLTLGNSNTDNKFACDCRSHWLVRDRTLYAGQIDVGFKCATNATMYSTTCA